MLLAGGHKAVDYSGPLGGFVGTSKEIVLSALSQKPVSHRKYR